MFDSCEPIRDSTDDRRDGQNCMSQQCSNCDDSVPAEDWHPVTTVRNDEGGIEIHLFCSETCRSAWKADRD